MSLGMLMYDNLQLEACCPIEEGSHIQVLSYKNNLIREITHLEGLVNLVLVDFTANEILAITGVSGVTKLRALLLGDNYLKEVNNLEALQLLEVLDLHHNLITSTSGLAALRNLRSLDLSHNNIHHLCDLGSLGCLTSLDLSHNQLSSLVGNKEGHLEGDTGPFPRNLRQLFLANNLLDSCTCLAPLKPLVQLQSLSLTKNPLARVQATSQYRLAIMQWAPLALELLDGEQVMPDKRLVLMMTHQRLGSTPSSGEEAAEFVLKGVKSYQLDKPRITQPGSPSSNASAGDAFNSQATREMQLAGTPRPPLLGEGGGQVDQDDAKEDQAADAAVLTLVAEYLAIQAKGSSDRGVAGTSLGTPRALTRSSELEISSLTTRSPRSAEVSTDVAGSGDAIEPPGGALVAYNAGYLCVTGRAIHALCNPSYSMACKVHLKQMAYEMVVGSLPHLGCLSRLEHLVLEDVGLVTLTQLHPLLALTHLRALTIKEDPLQHLTLARSYVAFQFKNLKRFNDATITSQERQEARAMFSPLATAMQEAMTQVPQAAATKAASNAFLAQMRAMEKQENQYASSSLAAQLAVMSEGKLERRWLDLAEVTSSQLLDQSIKVQQVLKDLRDKWPFMVEQAISK